MPSWVAISALLFAVFSVSLSYGALLPVLPSMIARLAGDPTNATLIHHTAIVTAAYAGAAFVASPISGRFADRGATRLLIVVALSLGALATALAGFARTMPELYILRIGAGIAAGAVTPAAHAWLGRWDDGHAGWQVQRLVWVSMAATVGFFAGPVIGTLSAIAVQTGTRLFDNPETVTFGVISAFQAITALAVLSFLPQAPAAVSPARYPPQRSLKVFQLILQISLIGLAISGFEVALALPLRGIKPDPVEIGVLFALCSLAMIVVQLLIAVSGINSHQFLRLRWPAVIGLAAGLIGMAWAPSVAGHIVSVILVATGGGALLLMLARELANLNGRAAGTAGGMTSSAGLAGQTAGAVLASVVVSVTGKPEFVFLVAAVIVVFAAFISTFRPVATKD